MYLNEFELKPQPCWAVSRQGKIDMISTLSFADILRTIFEQEMREIDVHVKEDRPLNDGTPFFTVSLDKRDPQAWRPTHKIITPFGWGPGVPATAWVVIPQNTSKEVQVLAHDTFHERYQHYVRR